MSKKLPRTSQRTLSDLRNAARDAMEAEIAADPIVEAVASDKAERRGGETTAMSSPSPASPSQATAAQADETAPGAAPKATPEPPPKAAARKPAPSRAVATRAPSRPAARAVVAVKPPTFDKAAFREAAGRMIVERHANLAAVTGLIPLPWVDLAAITAIVDRMFRKLARLYGMRLEGERSRQLATAMLTGVAVPAIATFTTSTLFQITLGQNLIGSALTCISAAVIVRIVGETYLTRLASETGRAGTDAGTIKSHEPVGA